MIMEHLNIPHSDWVRYEESYESIIWSSDPKCTKAEWEQAKIELKAAEPMRQLRMQRTAILAESDWMANSDVVMTDEWRAYRQALRDLPETQTPALDDNGNLINVEWPTPPGETSVS